MKKQISRNSLFAFSAVINISFILLIFSYISFFSISNDDDNSAKSTVGDLDAGGLRVKTHNDLLGENNDDQMNSPEAIDYYNNQQIKSHNNLKIAQDNEAMILQQKIKRLEKIKHSIDQQLNSPYVENENSGLRAGSIR